MSRELKFRAWDTRRKEWYLESNQSVLTYYGFAIFGECTLICSPDLEDLQYLEIDQFTGLLDSEGVDIYEGDIVDYAYTGCTGIEFSYVRPIECQSDGGFRMGGAQIQSNPHMVISGAFNKDVTVIGNIHESPELLK